MTEPEPFSLVRGGPLFRLFRRGSLSGDDLELVRRRAVLAVAVVWLPLLLLSVWEGNAWGDHIQLPFLRHLDAHARFLIALPLLLVAEVIVHRWVGPAMAQFTKRGLIPEGAQGEFAAAVESAARLRDSGWVELLLLGVVYGVGVLWTLPQRMAFEIPSWYGVSIDGKFHGSWAGVWFAFVSLPLLQFLLLRWYLRLFNWARFLWRVAHIELALVPTHPDRAAGLGFLGRATYAFGPLLVAQGIMSAGVLADLILYTGKTLQHFKAEIGGLVTLMVLFVVGPTLAFVPHLVRVKRKGLREYGMLAQEYVRAFDQKWVRGGIPRGSEVLGTSDIQSLADLGNSYEIVKSMRWAPFGMVTVSVLAAMALAPMLPLLLTVMPLGDLFEHLARILFGR